MVNTCLLNNFKIYIHKHLRSTGSVIIWNKFISGDDWHRKFPRHVFTAIGVVTINHCRRQINKIITEDDFLVPQSTIIYISCSNSMTTNSI